MPNNKILHSFSLGHHWRKSISITEFIDSIDLMNTALHRSCEHITQCYCSSVGVDPPIPLAPRPHRRSVKFPVSVFTLSHVLSNKFCKSGIQNTRKFTVPFPCFFAHSSSFSFFPKSISDPGNYSLCSSIMSLVVRGWMVLLHKASLLLTIYWASISHK